MVDPLSQQTLPPSPAEPNIKQEFRNARRHRHAWDASTTQAANLSQRIRHHYNVQALCFPVRADTAVRPYAEDLFQ